MTEYDTLTVELTPEDFRDMLDAREDDYADTVTALRFHGERVGILGEF